MDVDEKWTRFFGIGEFLGVTILGIFLDLLGVYFGWSRFVSGFIDRS